MPPLPSLFIPNKQRTALIQSELPIAFRTIERWVSGLNVATGSGGLYASLTGPGQTVTPGLLTQAGAFQVNAPSGSATSSGAGFEVNAYNGILMQNTASPGGGSINIGYASPYGVYVQSALRIRMEQTGTTALQLLNSGPTSGNQGIAITDNGGGGVSIGSVGAVNVNGNTGISLVTGGNSPVSINPISSGSNADIWLLPTNTSLGAINQVKITSSDTNPSGGGGNLMVQAGHTGAVPGNDPTLIIQADGLQINTPVDTTNDSGISIADNGTAGRGVSITSAHGSTHISSGPNVGLAVGNTTIGFFNNVGIAQPTITGSRGGNAALGVLLHALAQFNLIVDSSTP